MGIFNVLATYSVIIDNEMRESGDSYVRLNIEAVVLLS